MRATGPHIRKALSSSVWLLAERMLTLLINFGVSIALARYLGVEGFGTLNYAMAFVALLSTIPYLGFGGVVIQQLVQEADRRSETMGTVLYSKLLAAAFAFLLGNALAQLIVDEPAQRLLILIISVSMLFDVATALRLQFEALTRYKSVVVVSATSSVLGALMRILAIVLGAPLWVFAALIAVQAALAAIGFVAIYQQTGQILLKLRFTAGAARSLFSKSWPLIISAAASTLYLKIDQFMLGQMRGMTEVGTYAIAARLSEVWYVLPVAIVSSIFPRLVQLRAEDRSKYERRMRESILYLLWLGMGIAISVSLAAPFLVTTLFGEQYRAAGHILAIHVWACPAVFMGMIVEKWFVSENLLKFFISRQLLGAGVNIGLNLLLIPYYGGVGAAIATVASYTLAYYLSCFTSRKTAPAGKWMTQALIWPVVALARQRSRAPFS